jgi:hypothetical protein
MCVIILPFNSFALILILPIVPACLSQQPPSRTASDQQIRPPSKLHLQQQQQPSAQRTTTGAPRPSSPHRLDAGAATRSNKKSGFTLTSPVVTAHEVDGEGDSDEWVSSESVSVTPQNQSSDSESGDEDDDVVRHLPANLHLTGAAHVGTSPDDREPPTPTIPQVRMQPPTPANNGKEEPRRRSSTTSVPNETSAVLGGVDRHDRKRTVASTGDDHADAAAVVRAVDQQSVGDRDYPHSDHHIHPEDGLASTPRPRALDRDPEPSRHLPPGSLSDHPHSDSSARKPSVVNPRLGGDVQDRPQQPTLSAHSAPQSIADSSPGPRADDNPRRDQIAMTQVSNGPAAPAPCIRNTASFNCLCSYSLMLRSLPCSTNNISNNNSGHQVQLAGKTPLLALPQAQTITGTRIEPKPNTQA